MLDIETTRGEQGGVRSVPAFLARALVVFPLAWAAAVGPAAAQQPEEGTGRITVAEVEAANRAIELEETERLALAAIRQGRRPPEETARLYELLGFARTVLGNLDLAEQAYLRLLAIDPDRPVDPSLPPRLRPPFFEARGYWASSASRLGAEVRLTGSVEPRFVISLSDPIDMVDSVVLSYRPVGADAFTVVERTAESTVVIPGEDVGDGPTVEYTLTLLDEHRNALVELGSAAAPLEAANPRRTLLGGGGGTGSAPIEEPSDGGVLGSPVFLVTVAILLVGGAVAAGYFLLYDPPTNARFGVSFD